MAAGTARGEGGGAFGTSRLWQPPPTRPATVTARRLAVGCAAPDLPPGPGRLPPGAEVLSRLHVP